MTSTKKLIFYCLIIACPIALLELGSYGIGQFLRTKGVFYEPAAPMDRFDHYMKHRHPVLGWPIRDVRDKHRDKSGSMIIPAFPDPEKHPACVSVYGDSYTEAGNVAPEDSWANALSLLLKCRVANYGVEGYGTDQAVLRFILNEQDKAHTVILAVQPENILRNVNQFRNLLDPNTHFGLKPRYILDEHGNLKSVPLATCSKAEYKALVDNPNQYLKYEYFKLNGPSGNRKLTFPYTLSVIKAFGHFHVKSHFAGEPWYGAFYRKTHPSRALYLMSKIVAEFYNTAVHRSKVPIILIVPTYLDLEYHKKEHVWTFQNLIDLLKREAIVPLNAGPGLIRSAGDRDPRTALFDKTNHPNPEGYRVLAHIVYEHIKDSARKGPDQ